MRASKHLLTASISTERSAGATRADILVGEGGNRLVTQIFRYAVPLLVLSGVTGGFLCVRRHRPLGASTQYALAGVAALPLLASGTVHLLRPSVRVPLLPPWVPGRLLVIMATAVPEFAGAIGLFLAPVRRPAAAWLAVFMIAVFPANVYVAGQRVQGLTMPGVPVRTAMQAAYIVLLLIAGHGRPVFGRRPGDPARPRVL